MELAPKISGEFMAEVWHKDWEYVTNDLVINVYVMMDQLLDSANAKSSWAIKYKDNYISDAFTTMENSPQEAADQAVKFLHRLRDTINFIK